MPTMPADAPASSRKPGSRLTMKRQRPAAQPPTSSPKLKHESLPMSVQPPAAAEEPACTSEPEAAAAAAAHEPAASILPPETAADSCVDPQPPPLRDEVVRCHLCGEDLSLLSTAAHIEHMARCNMLAEQIAQEMACELPSHDTHATDSAAGAGVPMPAPSAGTGEDHTTSPPAGTGAARVAEMEGQSRAKAGPGQPDGPTPSVLQPTHADDALHVATSTGTASSATASAAAITAATVDAAITTPAAPAAPSCISTSSSSSKSLPSSLWRLAASLAPSDYATGGSFATLVTVATTASSTPEGLRCKACGYYILLQVGVHRDGSGAPLCASCASCAGLLDPRRRVPHEGRAGRGVSGGGRTLQSASCASGSSRGISAHAMVIDRGVVTDGGSEATDGTAGVDMGTEAAARSEIGAQATEAAEAAMAAEAAEAAEAARAAEEVRAEEVRADIEAAAQADLGSASAHAQMLLSRRGELSSEMARQMSQEGYALAEVGGQAVLAAFAEAEELLRQAACRAASRDDSSGASTHSEEQQAAGPDGAVPLAVFDELVRRWDAPVPMGLLRVLQGAATPPLQVGMVSAHDFADVSAVRSRVRRLRQHYATAYLAQGLCLGQYG